MKFKCEKCGTRYTIADEKVRRKVLKIRCKVCENVMIVRDPGASRRPAAMDPQRDLTPLAPGGLGGGLARLDPTPSGLFQTSRAAPAVEGAAPTTAPVPDVEWYAAPGGEQVGPMPVERLRDLLVGGELKPEDVVWNETMADWTAIKDVAALQGLLAPKSPPRPPPVPGAGIITRGRRREEMERRRAEEDRRREAEAHQHEEEEEAARLREAEARRLAEEVGAREEAERLRIAEQARGEEEALRLEAEAQRRVEDDRRRAEEDRALREAEEAEEAAEEAAAAEAAEVAAAEAAAAEAAAAEAAVATGAEAADTLHGALPFGIDLTGEHVGVGEGEPVGGDAAPTPPAPIPFEPLFGGLSSAAAVAGEATGEEDELAAVMAAELAAGPTEAVPALDAAAQPGSSGPPVAEVEPGGGDKGPLFPIDPREPVVPVGGAVNQHSVSVVVPAPASRKVLMGVMALLLVGGGVALGVALAPEPAPAVVAAPVVAPGAPTVAARTPPVAPTPPEPKVVADAEAASSSAPDAGPKPKAHTAKPRRRPAAKAPRVAAKRPDAARPRQRPAAHAGLLGGKDEHRVAAPTNRENLPKTLTQSQIVHTVKRYQRSITGCYQRQLKRDDTFKSARATLQFQIRSSGRTADMHLERRYQGTVLHTCLKRAVARWTFPQFRGEPIAVKYPLIFQASL